MTGRLRAALPTFGECVWGSLLWAAAIGTQVALALAGHGWSAAASVPVVATFVLGAGIAFVPGVAAARLLGGRKRREKRFAAMLLCLGAATVGITGAVYAWEYRGYYAQWHAEPFTRIWAIQFVFTGLVALYQFAAAGMRLMFPLGLIALLVGSFVLSRRVR